MLRGAVLGFGLCTVLAAPAAAQEVQIRPFSDRDIAVLGCCERALDDPRWTVRDAPSTRLFGGELKSTFVSAESQSGPDFHGARLALRYPVGGDGLYVQGGFGAAQANGALARFMPTDDRLYVGQRRLFTREVAVGWRLSRGWAVEAAYVRTSAGERITNLDYPGSNSVGLRMAFRMRR